MSELHNAFVVNAETGECSFSLFDSDSEKRLENMQDAVGGFIEYVFVNVTNFEAYVNEEGKLNHLPLNFIGGHILYKLGLDAESFIRPFIPVGNVLIVTANEKPFTAEERELLIKASNDDNDED